MCISYKLIYAIKKLLPKCFSALASYLHQVGGVEMPPNQFWFCRWFHLALYFGCMRGCHLLVAMTFESFYSIIQPHKAASFNTVKKARVIVAYIFGFGFSYSIPYLGIASNDGKLCIPNAIAADKIIGQVYNWLTETIIFIFPFLSLLIMNSVIIHTLRKRSKLPLLGLRDHSQNEDQNLKSKNPEKQIINMLLLVTFAYLSLNIPVRILVLYLNYFTGDTPYYYASLYLAYQVEEKIYYTNHAINIFLYVVSGQKFRRDLKNLFGSQKSETKWNVDFKGSVDNSTADSRLSVISSTDRLTKGEEKSISD